MSQSYQTGLRSGAEVGHSVQKPNVTADQGITAKANERPDVASNKETTARTDNKGDQSVPPNPDEVKEESAKEGGEDQEKGGDPSVDYPEQKHAGKVGYGPNYAEEHGHVPMTERFEGLKEEIMGKIKRDPKLAQEGHDKVTGEAKRKQPEENHSACKSAEPDEAEGGGAQESEGKDEQEGSGDKPIAEAAADASTDNRDEKESVKQQAARKAGQAVGPQERQKRPDDISQKPVSEGQEVTEAEQAEQNHPPRSR